MVSQELMEILQSKTEVTDLENQDLLHDIPKFGEEIGKVINSGKILLFSQNLSEHLESMDLYKASLLTNFIGFVCEQTGNTKAGQHIIKFFTHVCNLVYDLFQYVEKTKNENILEDKKALYALNAEWAKAYYGFNTVCVATMAFLVRDVNLRIILSQMDIFEKVQYLADDAPETPYLRSIYYVAAMPFTCGELKLLVMNPEQEKGFLATAKDLKNCFHLLFLLEEQIYQKLRNSIEMPGYFADASIMDLAHGEYPKDCWGKSYCTYFLELDYTSLALSKEELGQGNSYPLIWGEMSPNNIPMIDNHAVIVLWKKCINRNFSSEFMFVDHPALNPYVKIEKELTDEEYKYWLNRIKKELTV